MAGAVQRRFDGLTINSRQNRNRNKDDKPLCFTTMLRLYLTRKAAVLPPASILPKARPRRYLGAASGCALRPHPPWRRAAFAALAATIRAQTAAPAQPARPWPDPRIEVSQRCPYPPPWLAAYGPNPSRVKHSRRTSLSRCSKPLDTRYLYSYSPFVSLGAVIVTIINRNASENLVCLREPTGLICNESGRPFTRTGPSLVTLHSMPLYRELRPARSRT